MAVSCTGKLPPSATIRTADCLSSVARWWRMSTRLRMSAPMMPLYPSLTVPFSLERSSTRVAISESVDASPPPELPREDPPPPNRAKLEIPNFRPPLRLIRLFFQTGAKLTRLNPVAPASNCNYHSTCAHALEPAKIRPIPAQMGHGAIR